jgi:RNA polymerase sigma factor (TIGR02999 family)
MGSSDHSVTQLLAAWRQGDAGALDRLMPLIYAQLQALARHHLSGERPGHTLPATALVHEAYLKLVDANVDWQDRGHFFAIAARTMRRILVDHAKSRHSARRGGGSPVLPIEEIAVAGTEPPPQIVDLNDALNRLEAVDERKSRIVDLIYFGGLSQEETAAALDISPATVFRDLNFAKAWLVRELADPAA